MFYLFIFIFFWFSLAPNTKDLDVFLRKQESGFGFRVLGGEGPDQSVSSDASGFVHSYELLGSCLVEYGAFVLFFFSLSLFKYFVFSKHLMNERKNGISAGVVGSP